MQNNNKEQNQCLSNWQSPTPREAEEYKDILEEFEKHFYTFFVEQMPKHSVKSLPVDFIESVRDWNKSFLLSALKKQRAEIIESEGKAKSECCGASVTFGNTTQEFRCLGCNAKCKLLETEDVPMGVSQWREHGKKYEYWSYFEKEVKQEIIEKMEKEFAKKTWGHYDPFSIIKELK